MRNTTTRFITTAAVAASLLLMTACSPQSSEDFEEYAESLRRVPGVIDVETGVSTPLPWSVQGSVHATLPADHEVFDTFVDAACNTKVNATVSIDYSIEGEFSTVSSDESGCDGQELDPVATAVAADELFGSSVIALEYRPGADGRDAITTVGFEKEAELGTVLQLSHLIEPTLPGTSIQLDHPNLTISSTREDFAGYVSDLSSLAGAYPFEKAALGDDFVFTMTDAANQADVQAFLMALDPGRYEGHSILVTQAGNGSTSGNSSESAIALRDWVVSDLGAQGNTSGNELSIVATDIDSVVELSRAIAEHGSNGVTVSFYVPAGRSSNDPPEFRLGKGGSELTSAVNPYPDYAETYEVLANTGVVGTVEVGPSSLSVWLREDVYEDSSALKKVKAAMGSLNDANAYSTLSLNNKDFSGE